MNLNHCHGFTLTEKRVLPELDATMLRLTHDKTGLELVWLNRKEENKTFGIAFETLPWDDTGVFHILEHSVLCGSDKYPVKEPFVELMKSSLNTFLNAMTFPDKTVYPISSRNEKDFLNLVHVYLDAVFHPLIYSKPEIFRQEGWHYELDEAGKPSYKGVVFNEMKGSFASADEQVSVALNRGLFPDSPYGYVSGGDPARIPDLSYEAFLDSHRRFYSPSNAYVFLDGDLDIQTVLGILDDEYLSHYEKTERVVPPAMQAAVSKRVEQDYEVPETEELGGKTRLSYGSVIGKFDDREKLIAAKILTRVLCGTNQSPVSKAILAEGLAEDVSMMVYDGVAQPWVWVDIKNLAEENLSKVEETLHTVLENLATNGLDHDQIRAVMANTEFKLREREYGGFPSGLLFGLTMLETWLYGGDPATNLEVGDTFRHLEEKLDTGYFEALLRELFLDNNHSCTVVLHPSHNAGDARRKAESSRLLNESSLWTPEQRQEISNIQQKLIDWQNTPDTPEQLATIPQLKLDDIPQQPEPLPLNISRIDSISVLTHPGNTGGIVYTDLYFDAGSCSADKLPVLSFLCSLLGKTDTAEHTAEEIMNRRRLLCGDMGFSVTVHPVKGHEQPRILFRASFSALTEKLPQALGLVTEILTKSSFPENTVHDILKQTKSELFEQAVMAGHALGFLRLGAQFSQAGVADEALSGYSFYTWLKEQDTTWNWTSLRQDLETLLLQVVNRAGLYVGITGATEAQVQEVVQALSVLPEVPAAPTAVFTPWGKRKEGIIIPADICFAELGGDIAGVGGAFHGSMQLSAQILSLAYLWNAVRVQGGAYGVGLLARDTGMTACYSYRDPNGSASLQAYRNCGAFLKEFAENTQDFTGFIIGAVANASPLTTPKTRAAMADANFFRNISWEDRCETRRQLLTATSADLLKLASQLTELFENCGICIVGGKAQVEACKELDSTLTL